MAIAPDANPATPCAAFIASTLAACVAVISASFESSAGSWRRSSGAWAPNAAGFLTSCHTSSARQSARQLTTGLSTNRIVLDDVVVGGWRIIQRRWGGRSRASIAIVRRRVIGSRAGHGCDGWPCWLLLLLARYRRCWIACQPLLDVVFAQASDEAQRSTWTGAPEACKRVFDDDSDRGERDLPNGCASGSM